MAHGAVNIAFGMGAAAVVASSQADLAYVAGESGIATFVVVALAAAVPPGPGQGVAHGADRRTPTMRRSLEKVA